MEHIFSPQANSRLEWRWRVLTFPTGADERRAHLHDAAAQVYVVFDNQYWHGSSSIFGVPASPLERDLSIPYTVAAG